MQRRSVLASTGGLAVALLAGCLADGLDPSGGTPDDGSPSEDDVTPSVVDHTIETETTGCMSDEEDGVEAFAIEARTGEQSESIEVETSACYGPVEVGVNEDGTLYPTYGIC